MNGSGFTLVLGTPVTLNSSILNKESESKRLQGNEKSNDFCKNDTPSILFGSELEEVERSLNDGK